MEQMKKETDTTYWHPAFYAGLQIELQEDADNLVFEDEHLLGKEPMKIDVLIIKKENDRPVKKNIGRMFRKRNIVEYKGPGDSLSVDDFYKVYGYTCFYKADVASIDSIPVEELTITLVAEGFPRKMVKHLIEVKKYTVEEVEPGIYSVTGDTIPIQILVTSRLPPEENLWLRNLTDKLKSPETAYRLIEDYLDHKENNLFKALIKTIMHANQKIFEEVNGMSDIFMEIVQEKFDRKLKEAVDKEVDKAVDKAVDEAVNSMRDKVTEEVTSKVTEEVKRKATEERLIEYITLIWKKCARKKTLSVIADELETEPEKVLPVYNLIMENPEKTVDEIYQLVIA